MTRIRFDGCDLSPLQGTPVELSVPAPQSGTALPCRTMRIVRRGRLVALAAAVILVAGCGGSDRLSKVEYQREVQEAGIDVQNAARGLASARNSAEFVRAVQRTQAALARATKRLDDVEPPKEIEREHGEFVAALRGISDEFEALERAGRRNDAQEALRVRQRIQTSTAARRARAAARAMERKGYRLGVLGLTGG